MQPFDKALKCGCFGNVKKIQGSLGKKWGHAKRVQKSDILTTRGFQKCRIGLKWVNELQHEILSQLIIFSTLGITRVNKQTFCSGRCVKKRF